MTVGTLPRDRGLINKYISHSQLSNKCSGKDTLGVHVGGANLPDRRGEDVGRCRSRKEVCALKNVAAGLGSKNVKAPSLCEHEAKIAEWGCPAANEIVPK